MTQDRFKELQRMLTVQNELVRFQAVVILQEHMHEALKTREGLSWLRWSMRVLSEAAPADPTPHGPYYWPY